MTDMPAELSFNIAFSFATNTNWQNYGNQITIPYLVQMARLTVQNFVLAATDIAIDMALICSCTRA